MESYLPVIWAAIIGLAVAMYVILDGFDLGIGILFPFAETDHERDQMMNSVAPFWDGNETWLVLGGLHDGRLSAGVLDHSPGTLSAGHFHAAGPDISRSRLRVPLDRSDQQASLDLCLRC